jgi:glycosyltransferase involved in cell wall biosynthesis
MSEFHSFVVPLPTGIGVLRKAQTYMRLKKGHMMGVHEGVIEEFESTLERIAPQLVIFDTSLFGPLALNAKRRGCIVATQCHNCEFDYFAGQAALCGGIAAEHLRAVHRSETMSFEASDVVLTVSDYDRERLAIVYGRSRNTLVVNPMLFDLQERLASRVVFDRSEATDSKPNAVFVGSLWHQNRFACKMLVQGWRGDLAQLTVVGEVGNWLKREFGADRLHARGVGVAGFVDSIDRVLSAADTMVCPMQLGSGVKVKMIDALANGCPVLASIEAVHGFEFAEASGYVRQCGTEQMEILTAQARDWSLSPTRLQSDLADQAASQKYSLAQAYSSLGLGTATHV